MSDPGTDNRIAILKALIENGPLVLNEVAELLIHLGSKAEWSMDDNFLVTETIASLGERIGLPSGGTAAGVPFYLAAREASR